MFKKSLVFSIALLMSTVSYAGISMGTLSQSEFENISEEFTTNFVHTTVSGAGSLGKLFGVDVGLAVGATDSPTLKRMVAQSGGDDYAMLPHAAIVGQFSVPMGITVDASFLPSMDITDLEYNHLGLGVKWTFTDMMKIPLSIAVKGHLTSSGLKYSQTGSGVSANVTFEDTITGLTLLVSKSFMIVEPYAGFGIIHAESKMKYTGTNIFNFTASNSASADFDGQQFFVGANIHLMLMHIGLEYGEVLGNTKYTAKLSFGF